MNTFAVLLLCVQACLLQNALGQCYGSYGAEVINNAGLGYGYGSTIPPAAISVAAPYGGAAPAGLGYANGFPAPGYLGNAGSIGYGAAYGGAGEGNIAVAGELPTAGSTAIAGQVPILGAVSFGGNLPAAGSVSINGNCACGCAGYY